MLHLLIISRVHFASNIVDGLSKYVLIQHLQNLHITYFSVVNKKQINKYQV